MVNFPCQRGSKFISNCDEKKTKSGAISFFFSFSSETIEHFKIADVIKKITVTAIFQAFSLHYPRGTTTLHRKYRVKIASMTLKIAITARVGTISTGRDCARKNSIKNPRDVHFARSIFFLLPFFSVI